MNKRWPYSNLNKHRWKRKRVKPVMFYRNCDNIIQERRSTMDKFWELLSQSTIFQGVITLLLLSTTCYLWVTGNPVPDNLWTGCTFVLAFFFGAKTQQTIHQRVK